MQIARILALAVPLVLPFPAVQSAWADDPPKDNLPKEATKTPAKDHLKWVGWTPDLFDKAKAEKRLVILDLEAVWCHWCHVMEQQTYSNDKVQTLIESKFIAVRADQDANPDLSARYGDWGWPATIIFGPDGTEIAKLRGFVEPDRMEKLLKAVIDDPTPGPSVEAAAKVKPSTDAFLSPQQRAEVQKRYEESYDTDHGGWGGRLRYIDADSMDYALELTGDDDKTAEGQARKTLDVATALIDPVWGGVYQYSDNGAWDSPHYEKIMSFQAQYLRQYSEAYARWNDEKYLKAAKAIYGYLSQFMIGQDGGFMTSQDADLNEKVHGKEYYARDDAKRRIDGIPRIDSHQYARENGWAIAALAAYYDVTGDKKALDAAGNAAKWAKANRGLDGGGFRHDGKNRGGPFLGDTLAMGQAFLALYAATGDRSWLKDAMAAGDFMGAMFKDDAGGFLPSRGTEAGVGALRTASKQLDDQIAVARFMNLLGRYTGKDTYKAMAAHAMRYAVGAGVAVDDRPLPGLLLADRELSHEPTHVTVVGHKDDPAAQKLGAAARAIPAVYKRLDWWDMREGPLVNPDITYPELDKAAAFACGNRTCSLPTFSAEELNDAVDAMSKRDAKHAERTRSN